MMAFGSAFDGTTLVVDQIADDGIVIIDTDGPDGRFRVHDLSGTNTLDQLPDNFVVNLLDGTSSISVQLNQEFEGNFALNAGNGDRLVSFSGASNSILGNLEISAGAGEQILDLDAAVAMDIGRDLTINLGDDNDVIVDIDQALAVGGALSLFNVNQFVVASEASVVGNVNFDTSSESLDNEFRVDGILATSGNVEYTGGQGVDQFVMFAPQDKFIAGHLNIDLGKNTTAGFQLVQLSSVEIGGNFRAVSAGESVDTILTTPTTFINGNTFLDLAEGVNSIALRHQTGGDTVRIFGGDDNNAVLFATTGSAVDVFASFGSGDDDFQLSGATPINELLRLDFGRGDDTFNNDAGVYSSNVSLFDLNGFTSFYTINDDTLAIKQTTDSGDVIVDNGGIANAIRVGDTAGNFQEHTPVTNLRFLSKADASSDVSIDLDSSLSGNLGIKLRRGERNLSFTGSVNEIMGDLRIGGSDGRQFVNLAENADLIVGGNAAINLRGQADTVSDNDRQFQVDGNLFFRNVNDFEVNDTLNVGGNLVFSTLFETDDSSFVINDKLDVAGDLRYFGGQFADEILLGGVSTVQGSLFAHLGSNESFSGVQRVLLSGAAEIGGQLNLLSGPTDTSVILNLQADVGENIFINLEQTSGTNLVTLSGRNNNGEIGIFRGGNGIDKFVLSGNAQDMAFAALFNDGDDELEIDPDANILSGFLNFGEGNDTLINHADETNFDLAIVNL